MIDNALANASLLGAQYGLKSGSSVVSGLLEPGKSAPFSGLDTLKAALTAGQDPNQAAQALENFVKENVPNNGKLLHDINAVAVLEQLAAQPAPPATSAFVNPYTKILAQQNANADGSLQSVLTSLLS